VVRILTKKRGSSNLKSRKLLARENILLRGPKRSLKSLPMG